MQEKAFESWLKKQKITSYKNYISKISTIEKYYSDIDTEFNRDGCKNLLELFEYSQDDAINRREPKHCIPITPTADKERFQSILEGTSDYRTRINRYIAFRKSTDSSYLENISTQESIKSNNKICIPLNQIFCGPPGTGKTYKTITAALEILQPGKVPHIREKQKVDFDSWVKKGHIRFVTFHQSFSYEDFVEGIKAQTIHDTSDASVSRISYNIVDGLFKQFCHEALLATELEPYVLIIDEINRGNISNIFGELITLIEPSKRRGAPEALSVQLPYSREHFSVPNTLYIIGTMNTADRSLTGIDTALRRRFQFTEIDPEPELLDNVKLCGTEVSAGDMLRIMNERIAILLDKDHCLGHAYFLPLCDDCTLEKLRNIFRQNIIPLLQEYFFDDWQKIHWVLNDHKKRPELQFICQKSVDTEIFDDDILSQIHFQNWDVQETAFDLWESYIGIVDNHIQVKELHTKIYKEDQTYGLEVKEEATYKSNDGETYVIKRYIDNSIHVYINGYYVGNGNNRSNIHDIARKLNIKLKQNNTQLTGKELIARINALNNSQ